VMLCPAAVGRDGQRLKAEIARRRPTVMQATPSTWTMLFHAGWQNPEGLKVLCGGEALPRTLKQCFDAVSTPVWNLYGPTETTIWSTLARLDVASAISIGRPIANTQVYVLDRRLAPVPLGVAGDLYIGGVGVALGYHQQPELTAGAFVANPFAQGRMYRTGDRVRWRTDGVLEYLGRGDQQLKVRGYRVELGEIEAHLEGHGSVSQAAERSSWPETSRSKKEQ